MEKAANQFLKEQDLNLRCLKILTMKKRGCLEYCLAESYNGDVFTLNLENLFML